MEGGVKENENYAEAEAVSQAVTAATVLSVLLLRSLGGQRVEQMVLAWVSKAQQSCTETLLGIVGRVSC